MRERMIEMSELLGKVLASVSVSWDEYDGDRIEFKTSDETFVMYHPKDCCESVSLEDVTGDWADLLGHPLLVADERSKRGNVEDGTETWTFYHLATIKGTVVLRWYGTSNGYYSESVYLYRVED